MNIDDAVRQVFNSEVFGVQVRMPGSDEIARALRACPDRRQYPLRRAVHDFVPAALLATACLVAVVSGQPESVSARPLASELTRTLPADTGDTFIGIMVATGDFFRSADR